MELRSATLITLFSLGFGVSVHGQIDRITGKTWATRSEVLARHGMVCTSVPAATQVGLDVLKRGGSAVDAAIAANATLGLMEPVSNGIGGDLFAIVYSAKDHKLYGLNGSGRSPRGLSYEQMKSELAKLHREFLPPTGMLPISVPGAVDAWSELHQKFGKLSLGDDLSGAIHYAEEGFPVTELIAFYWGKSVPIYKGLPGAFLETYTLDGKGRAPEKGDIFKNPALAHSLRLIGEKGRDAFYKGEIADKIDAFMQANGGYLRKADFEKHKSEWVEPVSVNYRGYDVFELPPNGQGLATLEMLNLLEGFDLQKWGFNSPETLHAMVEAKKLAFADRAKYYADPDFSKVPIAGLISKKYADERRKLIDPDARREERRGRQPVVRPERHDLPLHRGRRGQHGEPDPEQFPRNGQRHRRAGTRLHVPGSRPAFLDGAGPRERLRARETAVSHHHPRLRDEGPEAVARLRRDGRRHAAAGSRARCSRT